MLPENEEHSVTQVTSVPMNEEDSVYYTVYECYR